MVHCSTEEFHPAIYFDGKELHNNHLKDLLYSLFSEDNTIIDNCDTLEKYLKNIIKDAAKENGMYYSNIPEFILAVKKYNNTATDEIDAVVGKNGQVQQNISIHEKQAKEQSKNISGPTL